MKNEWKIANPERYKAMQELKRSGACLPYDTRPHRERSRADANRAAIRRSMYE